MTKSENEKTDAITKLASSATIDSDKAIHL